jgi:hypothetical protein
MATLVIFPLSIFKNSESSLKIWKSVVKMIKVYIVNSKNHAYFASDVFINTLQYFFH